MKISKKLVLILAIVFLISGGITAIMAVNDAQAWQQDDYYAADTWEPYAAEWTLGLAPQGSLEIDFNSVDVVIAASDEQVMRASFTGHRLLPAQDGFQPEVVVNEDPQHLRLSERSRNQNNRLIFNLWGDWGQSGSGLRGTLTLAVPRDGLGNLNVDLFAGQISARDFAAAAVSLSISSGGIAAENLTVAGPFTASTFSGDLKLANVQAQRGSIDTSSGSATVSGLQFASLTSDQFSGDLDLTDSQVTGLVSLSNSSGRIALAQLQAESLNITTFSGDVALQDCATTGNLAIDGSSSNILCETVTADQLNITSFSGWVHCPELTVKKLITDSSSGDLEATLNQMADLDLTSFSGAVQLVIPADSGFSLGVETFSGTVDIGFPLTIQTPPDDSGKDVAGVVGSGEHTVKVETSSGDVQINPAAAETGNTVL